MLHGTTHRPEFIARLPEDMRKHIVAAYASEWSAREDHSGYIHHLFPNGAVFVIRGRTDPRLAAVRNKYPQYNDLSDAELASALSTKRPAEYGDLVPDAFVLDEDFEKVISAYDRVVADATHAARWSFSGYALLAWLIPCGSLYALGWSVAWIRRGFRGSNSAHIA
jgi:hypothetical protein